MRSNFRSEVVIALLICLIFATVVLANADYVVGVEAGDWVKYEISYLGTSQELPSRMLWTKIEILNAAGTMVTFRQTDSYADGTETNRTSSFQLVSNGMVQSGLFTPANSKTGDQMYVSAGVGNITIGGETTRTYAGASRTVVSASYSFAGIQFTNYWDKQNGILVETLVSQGEDSSNQKLTETNMWSADSFGELGGWIWIVVAAVVGALIVFLFFLRIRSSAKSTRRNFRNSNTHESCFSLNLGLFGPNGRF